MNPVAAAFEVRAAMDQLEPEPEHTRHVAFLALRVFDALRPVHGLGEEERVLLEGAACLHDIGWPVSRRGVGHHKHSARLIRQYPWISLNKDEVETMALVARYHRRALPCSEHGDYHHMTSDRKRTVRILAAILRLADAFDRSHLQHVRDVTAAVHEGTIEFILTSADEPAREIAAAAKKGDLARQVFGSELLFHHQTGVPVISRTPGSAFSDPPKGAA